MWETAELMRDALPNPSNPYLRLANVAGTRNEIQTPAERRYEGLKPLQPAPPQIHTIEDLEPEDGVRSFIAEAAAAKMRIDAFLAKAPVKVVDGLRLRASELTVLIEKTRTALHSLDALDTVGGR